MAKIKTKQQAFESVARGLREFGYPDATAKMIEETYAAMKEGKTGMDLPHGIISAFAESQINEVRSDFDNLR